MTTEPSLERLCGHPRLGAQTSRVISGVLVATLALIAGPAVATAQEVGQEPGVPMPYTEYRAAIEAAAADDDVLDGRSPVPEETGTVFDVSPVFDLSLDQARSEIERLSTITPEACYAAAHQEILAYLEAVVRVHADGLLLAETAGTLTRVFAIMGSMREEVQASHPLAFIEDELELGGYGPTDSSSSTRWRPVWRHLRHHPRPSPHRPRRANESASAVTVLDRQATWSAPEPASRR